MSKKNPLRPLKPRTTEKLSGTQVRMTFGFDLAAFTALQWTELWLNREGPRRVPQAAIVRRALRVYAEHLEAIEPDLRMHELQAVRRASDPSPAREETRWAAEVRMAETAGDVLAGAELVSLSDVLHGHGSAEWSAAITAHAEALAATLITPRMRRSTTATTTTPEPTHE